MCRARPASITMTAAFCLLIAMTGLSACGGGGGGSGSSGGSSSSSSSTGPETGTLAVVDFDHQLKIQNASSGQFLTISGASQTAGAAISQAVDGTGTELLWHAIPFVTNQYNLENLLTHQVAGITNASKDAGATTVQWADNGTNDHLWSFYKLKNGNYLIRNVNSGLYLQAEGAAVTQGVRVSSGNAQEWTLSLTNIAAYPMPATVSGTGVDVHDPDILIDPTGKTWLYGTHNTLASSMDLSAFSKITAGIFNTDFSWWASKNTTGSGGRTDLWAPTTMYANGQYYQYYSIPIYQTPSNSTTNNGAQAVIALAISTNPDGPWTDAGQIIDSCGKTAGCTTTFNAIDPAPFIDASGKWWMVFGSWEDGTHVVPLDPITGLRQGTDLFSIARRDAGEEGPFIFPWIVNGTQYYYYFASINVCCKADSPYRIIVGRSTSPTGPYLDRGGLDLKDGGGTILLSAHSNIRGPGGQSVFVSGGEVKMVYHYYDSNTNGAPKLGINTLGFDTDGWPFVQ